MTVKGRGPGYRGKKLKKLVWVRKNNLIYFKYRSK